MSSPRDPGSFELRALPSSESPDGHPQPDFTSAFRQEAARRQGGDCVWSQSSPSSRHPATCNSLVNLTPAAGETRKWGGPGQTPGGEVEGGRGASSQAGRAGVWYLPAHLSWVPVQWGHSDLHGGITGPPTPPRATLWPRKAKDISQETMPSGDRH